MRKKYTRDVERDSVVSKSKGSFLENSPVFHDVSEVAKFFSTSTSYAGRRFIKEILLLYKNLVITSNDAKVALGSEHGTLHIAFSVVRDCNVRTS